MKSKKFILQVAGYFLLVVLFVFSVGFASRKQAKMPCSSILIHIVDSVTTGFVTESDILQTIKDKFGTLEGKDMSSINKSLLEKIINTNPFIYNAEVFSTVDGKLIIDVKQRIPVLRLINYKNESFYIDKEGIFMPQSDKFTSRVPVANGFIFDREVERRVNIFDVAKNDSTASKTKISQLFNIALYCGKSEFWNAEIEQLFVNEDGEIEVIPRVGNHTVILGDDQHLDEKFTKLFHFYKDVLSKYGWEKYKAINLKYKNQIVCIK